MERICNRCGGRSCDCWYRGAAAVYVGTGSFAGAFTATTVATASTGVLGGAVAAGVGTAIGGPILGLGNQAVFGDPYSFKDYGKSILVSAAFGGVLGGISAGIKNYYNPGAQVNIWTGHKSSYGSSPWSFTNSPKLVGSVSEESLILTEFDGKEMTKVGRWMSQSEYETMRTTGKMVEGAGGKTSVSVGGSESFKAAAKGSVYAEFYVPTKSLVPGGNSEWFSILGPNASRPQIYMLQKQGGELLPKILGLSEIIHIK